MRLLLYKQQVCWVYAKAQHWLLILELCYLKLMVFFFLSEAFILYVW